MLNVFSRRTISAVVLLRLLVLILCPIHSTTYSTLYWNDNLSFASPARRSTTRPRSVGPGKIFQGQQHYKFPRVTRLPLARLRVCIIIVDNNVQCVVPNEYDESQDGQIVEQSS